MKIKDAAKIAKKITKKATRPAYITANNTMVAFNEDMSVLFEAEIEAAIEDTGKTYDAATLDYIAKADTITGGAAIDPDNIAAYNTPVDDYKPVVTLDIKALKYISEYTSKDASRPVITGFHIGGGYIEACDGFRATRYKIDTAPDCSIIIPAAVLAYGGLKNAVTIEAGAKYARITSDAGAVFYARLLAGNYINLESIYTKNPKNVITLKDPAAVLQFVDNMRALKDKENKYRLAPLLLHLEGGRLELAFDSATVNGYKVFEVDNNNPDNEITLAINPGYIYTALKGGANMIELAGGTGPLIFKEENTTGFESLLLPVRFTECEIKAIIDDVKAATVAPATDSSNDTPAPAVEDPTPATATPATTGNDTSMDAPEDANINQDTPPAAAPIPNEIYEAVYNAGKLIFTLKRRNYEPTPAAIEYAENYARNHREQINIMQKARGHVYTTGLELVAAVYILQKGGIAA
jgi:hypothetical protein